MGSSGRRGKSGRRWQRGGWHRSAPLGGGGGGWGGEGGSASLQACGLAREDDECGFRHS